MIKSTYMENYDNGTTVKFILRIYQSNLIANPLMKQYTFSQDDSKSAKTNMHRKRNREIIILSKQFSSSDFRRQKIDLYLFYITFGVQNISYQ